MSNSFKIGNVKIGLDADLFLFAGPCVIESLDNCLEIAEAVLKISKKLGIPYVFKASFDKANRSSASSFRGPGLEEGLKILDAVRTKTGLPVLTDVHEASQAKAIGLVVDCLQIPAFLCRQTDLLIAAAETGKPVNVKKGQFMSPEEMTNVVDKLKSAGNDKIMLTERGTFFGYNRLVNDMTSLVKMKSLGCPAIFDVTHSTQMPGGLGNASAGQRDMGPTLAKAAVAAGANGLFIETHTDIKNAKSDAAVVMPIEWLDGVLGDCKKIFEIVRK
jgi:2-dehydro-3-deoxyphosphooctonate aldolase (KDO 8-P synthase)